jgi:hypothetical protein
MKNHPQLQHFLDVDVKRCCSTGFAAAKELSSAFSFFSTVKPEEGLRFRSKAILQG